MLYGFLSHRLLFSTILISIISVHAADIKFAISSGELERFFGNKSGILVYTLDEKNENGIDITSIYFTSSNNNSLTAKKVCEGDFPKISPEGTGILYVHSQALYTRNLTENSPDADKHKIAENTHMYHHHWWIHPNTKEVYVLYCIKGEGIFCQKLDNSNKPTGNPTKLFDHWGANAGRSGDGRFLGGNGLDRVDGKLSQGMWEIAPANAVANASEKSFVKFIGSAVKWQGFCHGNMSPAKPDEPFYGSLIHLVGGHFAIHIRDFKPGLTIDTSISKVIYVPNRPDRSPIPPSVYTDGYLYPTWEMLIWSTHPEYITAYSTGQKKLNDTTGMASHLFVINLTTEKFLRITNGRNNSMYSHLWINRDSQNQQPIKSVVTGTPTRGQAPLSVSFDGSSSAGTNLTYTWQFGDGQIGNGAKTAHTYTQAGSYIARLIVKSGNKTDTSMIDIIVDAHAVEAYKIDITPEGPTRIIKNTNMQFGADVFDRDEKGIPDADIQWSCVGNGGGSIDTNGRYTAGTGIEKQDTIIAISGSIKKRSIVTVADYPIRILSEHAGKTYTVGDTLTIRYETDPTFVSSITINLSVNNGKTSTVISDRNSSIGYGSNGWGIFKWIIKDFIPGEGPNNGISTISQECKIKIVDYNLSGYSAASDGLFTIKKSSAVNNPVHSRSITPRMHLVNRSDGYEINVQCKELFTITIFNLKGSVVANYQGNKKESILVKNTELAPGYYFINLVTSNESLSHGLFLPF